MEYASLNGSGKKLTASDKLTVSRKEFKFLLGLEDRLKLLQALDTLLIPDAYGDYDGYSVRSVYFDGIDNQDYYQKLTKEAFQKRVRLRVYNPTDETAKFEIKKKWSHSQIKETVVVTREHARQMLEGDFSSLLEYDDPTAELGYEICTTMSYRPVSMVEYKRKAYTHPQFSTRITLDNELRYRNWEYGLFDDDDQNYRAVTDLRETILEVKYDTYLLPYIQDVLASLNLRPCPISKFGSSRSLLAEFYN